MNHGNRIRQRPHIDIGNVIESFCYEPAEKVSGAEKRIAAVHSDEPRGRNDRLEDVDRRNRAIDGRLVPHRVGPAAKITEVHDVDLVVSDIAIVGDDQPLLRCVPGEIEWISKSAGELLHRAVWKQTKHFAAVPFRKRRLKIAAVIADADENRSVGGNDRIPAVVLRAGAPCRHVFIADKRMEDGLRTGC